MNLKPVTTRSLRVIRVRQLPGVVDLVAGRIISGRPLSPLGGGLQLPVVDLVQEHLGQLHDGLALPGGEVTELILHKVVHSLWREHTHTHTHTHKDKECLQSDSACQNSF